MSAGRYAIFVVGLLAGGGATFAQAPPATRVAPAASYGVVSRPRVGDVTRLQGQGINVLVGHGLVTGLDGTGDGSKFLPTIEKLATMLNRFGGGVQPIDVGGTKNVAIVMLRAQIPEHGAREGDRIDVRVTALAAKSLDGGQLLSTPLTYHDPTVKGLFAFAEGTTVVDGTSPNSAVIRDGARLEVDVPMDVVVRGSELRNAGYLNPWIKADQTYITLVLDEGHAGWSMAAAVAQAVDKELELSVPVGVDRVALAMDMKSIVVLLPEHQRGDPASWIRDVQRAPVFVESNEARVTINRNAGTIVVTGDTRISPVVVSQLGLTVTVSNPLPDGTIPVAPFEQLDFVAVDRESARLPNVRDLLEALNRLKVPFKDRVSILEEIHRAGRLHARMLYEG